MSRRSTPIFIACGVACMVLLVFAVRVVREETVTHLFQPKDGEVVAIKSMQNGKYFEVSPTDGRLYASASKPVNKTALFRVMLLSKPMVDMLADAMRTTNVAKWSRRKMSTKSGCKCSGFSNDHGFGSHCYSWEFASQAPWCYVGDDCKGDGLKGSFGRKFEECTSSYEFDDYSYPYPEYNAQDYNYTDPGAPLGLLSRTRTCPRLPTSPPPFRHR